MAGRGNGKEELEDGSKYTFEVNPDDSVESIKEKIKDKTGVDVDIFVDKDADNVSTGDLNSNDNNVSSPQDFLEASAVRAAIAESSR